MRIPTVSANYAIVALLMHPPWNELFCWPQIADLLPIGSRVLLVHPH